MRKALGISYNGADFHGWQIQKQRKSIQQQVEQALSHVANHPVASICAGRTDAGVHAFGQVIHFDTDAERPDHAWVFGANTLLPETIRVQWAQTVPDTFHARFSALQRRYCYLICQQNHLPPFWAKRAWWQMSAIDIESMQNAAHYLMGEHDFSSFRGRDCQSKTPVRRIDRISVYSEMEAFSQTRLIKIEISANAFLHHMVRNIVGSLIKVGLGQQNPEWILEVLNARDRKVAGRTAPAEGLYFMSVTYPDHFNLSINPVNDKAPPE